MNLIVWRVQLHACELMPNFVCKENKIAVIVLKILGATIQNSVAGATRCPGFVCP
jgi:hypothetical protein